MDAILTHAFANNEEPFVRYKNFFNAHLIEVVSQESGADVPYQDVFRDTALGANYDCANIARLLCINGSQASTILSRSLANTDIRMDMAFVSVNSARYGGSGGAMAVFAGGNSASGDIALHEMGHTFSGLADEYGGFDAAYFGPDPTETNVTTNASGAKWSHWIGYNQPNIGTIGAYEGARFYDHGIYRPSMNSKMRTLGRPFDAVSREKLILDIYNLVNPLDAWLDNTNALSNPSTLWVDSIDPSVITVEWYVDGVQVHQGDVFHPRTAGLAPGLHLVQARAVDPTDWVRIHRDRLEQTVSWNIKVSSLADVNNDGIVDGADIAIIFRGWGNLAVTPADTFSDVAMDGHVDGADLAVLYGAWTGDANP